ncbi:MAG: hypothetical protein NTU44_06255 [Bacteroidetes bacterium]|nr:hypothetical protein [Bacteroidota bacterium]
MKTITLFMLFFSGLSFAGQAEGFTWNSNCQSGPSPLSEDIGTNAICFDGLTHSITVSGAVNGETYCLFKDNVATGTCITCNLPTPVTFTSINSIGIYTVKKGATLITGSFTIKELPVASDGTASTCSDVALNYNLVNQVTVLQSGVTFTYTVSSSNQAQVPSGPNRTTASAANITDSYHNVTGSDVTITYTVTPIATNTCSGHTFTVSVTVKSEPVASNGTASTCSDIALNFNLVNLVTSHIQ